MNPRRVVVTGLGIVTSLGQTVSEYWENLLAGKSGITRIERFDPSSLTTQIAAEIKQFDPTWYMGAKTAKHLDPFSQFAYVATHNALADAGLFKPRSDTKPPSEWSDEDLTIDANKVNPTRAGAIIGSGIGGITELEHQHNILIERGAERVSPFLVPAIMLNAASGGVAIRFGLRGPNYSTASACASANHALGCAFRHVKYGDADVMVAGASEATITLIVMAGFCKARAMSRRNHEPQRASRPFDKDRDGFVMGEGAGICVFEELEHAKRRGARIYAEVVGFGVTDDAYHITAPCVDGDGAQRSMAMAIAESGLPKEAFTYINAHGTSTDLNDKMETLAVHGVFGPHAKKLCISSTKSMIGHLLGASGAAELVATVMSIYTQRVHPTANLEHPGEGCDLDYIQGESRAWTIPAALSNSFGFGGHNATLALRRYE